MLGTSPPPHPPPLKIKWKWMGVLPLPHSFCNNILYYFVLHVYPHHVILYCSTIHQVLWGLYVFQRLVQRKHFEYQDVPYKEYSSCVGGKRYWWLLMILSHALMYLSPCIPPKTKHLFHLNQKYKHCFLLNNKYLHHWWCTYIRCHTSTCYKHYTLTTP